MLIHNIFTVPVFGLVQYLRNAKSSVHLSSIFVGHPVLFKILYCPVGMLQVLLMGSMISELTFNTIMAVLPPFFYITTFSSFRYLFTRFSPFKWDILYLISDLRGKFNKMLSTVFHRLSSQKRKEDNFFLQCKENGVSNLVRFLRSAQVVCSAYGKMFQGRILPLNFVLSYFTTISLFSLIQYHHKLSWELIMILSSVGFSACTGWSIMLWLLGEYYRTGQKFIVSWKFSEWINNRLSGFERKLMRKFYRSCKPIEFTTTPKIIRFRPVIVFKYLYFITWLLAKALIVT